MYWHWWCMWLVLLLCVPTRIRNTGWKTHVLTLVVYVACTSSMCMWLRRTEPNLLKNKILKMYGTVKHQGTKRTLLRKNPDYVRRVTGTRWWVPVLSFQNFNAGLVFPILMNTKKLRWMKSTGNAHLYRDTFRNAPSSSRRPLGQHLKGTVDPLGNKY